MKYKALLLDCDGLMFETETIWQHYFFEANKIFNLNFTEQDRINITGMNEETIRQKLKNANTNLDVDAYREWQHKRVAEHINTKGVETKPFLKELIQYAKANNIKLAVVSGSKKEVVLKYLKFNSISEKDFDVFATGELVIKPKPNADIYLYACQKLNLNPNECVVLEDSHLGVEAGHNAGCFTIMVPDLMPVTEHMKNTADLILNNLNDVITFLNKN